ncbi:MAG: HNH endonuclease [Anaeroplasmataceae bacterium]|nr:HNH endonuclease [Anaeroplasmataceae bacterium]
MSKYTTIEIWNEVYGKLEEVKDYAGRLMKKTACGNPDSKYHPTLDHIRPISKGGKDIKGNLKICHTLTNEEKGDDFPHWMTNGKKFKAKKKDGELGSYIVVPN